MLGVYMLEKDTGYKLVVAKSGEHALLIDALPFKNQMLYHEKAREAMVRQQVQALSEENLREVLLEAVKLRYDVVEQAMWNLL